MLILFIDDSSDRHNMVEKILGTNHKILHAFDCKEALDTISSCSAKIGMVFFDHDLFDFMCPNCSNKLTHKVSSDIVLHPQDMFCSDCGWKHGDEGQIIERTGSSIITDMFLMAQEKWPATAIVHSHNPKAKFMAEDLNKAGIYTRQIPFSKEMIRHIAAELSEN